MKPSAVRHASCSRRRSHAGHLHLGFYRARQSGMLCCNLRPGCTCWGVSSRQHSDVAIS
jgi:hypothetical protein